MLPSKTGSREAACAVNISTNAKSMQRDVQARNRTFLAVVYTKFMCSIVKDA